MENNKDADSLFNKLATGKLSAEEQSLLENWYLVWGQDEPLDLSEEDLELILSKLDRSIPNLGKSRPAMMDLPSVLRVAAAVLIFFVSGFVFYKIYWQPVDKANYNVVIKPGKYGATLTLSNGNKLDLRKVTNQLLAAEAAASIKSVAGKIVYETNKSPAANPEVFNTLTTANGEQFQVELPDGSNVWLNSASSLTYPASFSGLAMRKVKLTGEGYFEVAKDKAHPFIVSTDGQNVEVLGTHFDISAFAEDGQTVTTLAQGLIRINGQLLKPNQQAIKTDGELLISPADPAAAIAWKNGQFVFNDEPLETIMRKIARWYNVRIVYREGADKRFLYGGTISKYDDVEMVLKQLATAGNMHYEIKEKTIYISK